MEAPEVTPQAEPQAGTQAATRPVARAADKARWGVLQQRYAAAYTQSSMYDRKMNAKYGSAWAFRACGRAYERARSEMLNKRCRRAANALLAWLDKFSPWYWHAGVGYHWLCTNLTVEQALSSEAPLLPAAAACYGSAAVPFRPLAAPVRVDTSRVREGG